MSWWARSSLRTKIFVAFSALIVAVLLATLSLTQFIVSREAQRTLSRELLTTGQVFRGLLDERAARLRSSSVQLASDFALKQVIADASGSIEVRCGDAFRPPRRTIRRASMWSCCGSRMRPACCSACHPEQAHLGRFDGDAATREGSLATQEAAPASRRSTARCFSSWWFRCSRRMSSATWCWGM